LSFVSVAGQSIQHAQGVVTKREDRVDFTLDLQAGQGRQTRAQGALTLALPEHRVQVNTLAVTLGRAPWTLAGGAPSVRWGPEGVTFDPFAFVTGTGRDERITVSGDWRRDGAG